MILSHYNTVTLSACKIFVVTNFAWIVRLEAYLLKTMQASKDSKHAVDDDPTVFASSNPDENVPSTGSQYGSVEPHIFTNSARAEHWRGVYEESRYECRHRFDPTFQWSAEEEKQAKRKVSMILR